MAKFLSIGHHFLNLEQVADIELVPDRNDRDKSKLACVRVHFTSGHKQEFKDADQMRQLEDFVLSHPAQ